MTDNIKNKTRKLEYKARGLCVNCGRPRSPSSISKCDNCLDKDKAYRRSQRNSTKEYKARGPRTKPLF